MFHKSKNLILYTSLLYIIFCIVTGFFINLNTQKDYNKNLISENGFRLEITNLSDKPLNINSFKEDIKLINGSFSIYKTLINSGVAIYTNDSNLIEELPIYEFPQLFSNESNAIILNDDLNNNTINNKLSVSNINFNVLDIYKDNPKFSDFFINLFGNDFSEKEPISGTYYIDTDSVNKPIVIENLTTILNSFEDKISFNITGIEKNIYNKLFNILLSQGIIGPIFVFLILLAIFNLTISISNWINNNKMEIFSRKVVGATDANILLEFIYTFFKISLISIILGIFTSIGSLIFFQLKNILVYYNILFSSLLILLIIQITVIAIYYKTLIANKKIIHIIKRGLD